MVLVLLLFLLASISEIQLCNIDVCLTWSATKEKISFKCKVNALLFTVKFFNQFHKEQAYCVSPKPHVLCVPLLRNSNITQDVVQNITILTLERRIDDSINGGWTCYHGTNVDKAVVNVTVLRGAVTDEHSEDICWKKNSTWTFVGFLIAFLVCFTVRCMQESLNMHCTVVNQRINRIKRICSKNQCIQKVYSFVLKRVIFYLLIVALITLPLVGYGKVDCSGQYNYIAFGLVVGFILIYLFVTEKGSKCCQINCNQARPGGSNQNIIEDVEHQPNTSKEINQQQDRRLDDGTNQEAPKQDGDNETEPFQTND